MKQCQIHQGEDEKYICIHKTKLKKEGNKLSCIQCLNWKKSQDYIKNMKQVEVDGKANVAKYVEMQNRIINSNNEMKQQYLDQLKKLQQKLNEYFQKQQKSITSLIEQQNQILTQNINQAQSLLNEKSVLDSKSIDNFIIFTILNQAKQEKIENKYTQINKCLERQFKYEFAEIQCRVNLFTTIEFKFDNVPKSEVEQFQIQTVEIQKEQLPYCNDHQIEKKYICIHEDCLKENKQEYLCLDCANIYHQQHTQGNYLKTSKKIKKDQIETLKLIEQQNLIFQQDVESRIDKELTANQKTEQENFIKYQTIRQNLKQFEIQIKTNPFNQNPKYIYNNIDQNLLSQNSSVIQSQFQFKLNQLEQDITKIRKVEFPQQWNKHQVQQLTEKNDTYQPNLKPVIHFKNSVDNLQIQIPVKSSSSTMDRQTVINFQPIQQTQSMLFNPQHQFRHTTYLPGTSSNPSSLDMAKSFKPLDMGGNK